MIATPRASLRGANRVCDDDHGIDPAPPPIYRTDHHVQRSSKSLSPRVCRRRLGSPPAVCSKPLSCFSYSVLCSGRPATTAAVVRRRLLGSLRCRPATTPAVVRRRLLGSLRCRPATTAAVV